MPNHLTKSVAPEPSPAPAPGQMSQNDTKCSAIQNLPSAEMPDSADNPIPDNALAKSPPQPPDVAVLHLPGIPPPAALEPKQLQALELIFLGLRDVEVAEKLGVHRQTILRWKKIPAFAAALEVHGHEAQRAAISGLRALLPDVVRALQWQLKAQNNDLNYRAAALLLRTLFRQTRAKEESG